MVEVYLNIIKKKLFLINVNKQVPAHSAGQKLVLIKIEFWDDGGIVK